MSLRGEQAKVRPRIRLRRRGTRHRWECIGMHLGTHEYATGRGHTPLGAYHDWLRRVTSRV